MIKIVANKTCIGEIRTFLFIELIAEGNHVNFLIKMMKSIFGLNIEKETI
jgi:hypothetical protein